MSTLKEITESKTTIYIKPKEGFFLSLSRDLVTFGFIALCIYISQDSKWWTFVTGTLFLLTAAAKLKGLLEKNTTTFRTADDAINYLKDLAKAR